MKMSETVVVDKAPARPPLAYWVVAIVGALWNAFGATDYVMTRTRNQAWVAQGGDPAAILAWVDAMPLWAQVGWGLGVWGSVAGSVLMLVRSRHAAAAFLVSLIGAVVSFAYQFTHAMPGPAANTAAVVMPLVILAIVTALWRYCAHAARRGWLR
jgi:hypothetical protein